MPISAPPNSRVVVPQTNQEVTGVLAPPPRTPHCIKNMSSPPVSRTSRVAEMSITSYPKSSLLAAPAASSSSKPPSTVRQAVEPQSQAHADTLARHGIKVRDFAHESKLPAVRPFRKKQVQPEPPSLKRVNTDDDDYLDDSKDSNGTQAVAGSSKKKGNLRRELTEPDIQETSMIAVPIRDRVITNFLDHTNTQDLQSSDGNSQQNEWPSSQPPPPCFDSQPSEPYTTPLVTPNGSLHWIVGESSSIPPTRPDTATSPPSISEGIDPAKIALQFPKDPTGLFGTLSPMSSLSSITDASPAPLAVSKGHNPPGLPRNSKETPLRSSPLRPAASLPGSNRTPRYHLRRRPAKPPSHTTSTRQSRCPRHTVTHPSPRPLAHSIQSSHSRAKPSSGSGSPGARPLRKRQRITI